MAIYTEGGMITFECDYCQKLLETDPGVSFRDAAATGRDAGWKFFREGTKWHHVCQTCAWKTKKRLRR